MPELGNYMRRLLYHMALPLMAACSRSAERAPEQSAPQVAVPTRDVARAADELAPLQLARLDYTFQAAQLVQRDWPEMQPAKTCVLLVEAARQWVVNCDVAPAHFAPTLQHFREHPIYLHRGGTFDAGGQSRSTAQLLAATPAAAQVPGAAPDNALPGANPWLVIGSLEALSEYHPAFKQATTEAWVSVVIHELVHTHQLRAPGAERFREAIAKLERTSTALTELYVHNARYHAAIEREYALLTQAAQVEPNDKRAAQRALARWLTLYDHRSALLHDSQLIADDALFTYLEGVARFVESQFLEDPSLHPAHALTGDPRFGHYKLFLGNGYTGSPNRQLDDQYFYAIGYHVCVLLDRLDTRWRSRVHSREKFLFDVAREVAGAAK